jgi:branched-chain amino acid transport system permease protein
MFLEQTINGLALGSVYALIAVGYTLIFGILGILNYAHASFYAFAANLLLMLISAHFGIIPAVILVAVLTGVFDAVYNRTLLEPLRKKHADGVVSLITAIGFSYVLENLMIAFLGSERKAFPDVFGLKLFEFFGVKVQISQIYMFTISIALLLILILIVYKTKFGMSMRAVQQNTRAANLVGVNVSRTITFTFFLSGLFASIAGFLVASYYMMVYPKMGTTIGTKAFVAAIIGGIGVLHGSVVGGLLIGLAECYAVFFFGANVRDAVSFIILIILLLVRPQGIFGKKRNIKV